MASRLEQLYEEDFYAWTQDQARALRQLAQTRPNLEIDFAHLVEEVEDLGSERLLSVLSQTQRLIEHLLKLEYSRAGDPRLGWLRTVDDARDTLLDRLTPTIPHHLVAKLPGLFARARKGAARELRRHREPYAAAALPEACPYTLDQLLDEDWYPANRHGFADE